MREHRLWRLVSWSVRQAGILVVAPLASMRDHTGRVDTRGFFVSFRGRGHCVQGMGAESACTAPDRKSAALCHAAGPNDGAQSLSLPDAAYNNILNIDIIKQSDNEICYNGGECGLCLSFLSRGEASGRALGGDYCAVCFPGLFCVCGGIRKLQALLEYEGVHRLVYRSRHAAQCQ
jgi:hypothetical protein